MTPYEKEVIKRSREQDVDDEVARKIIKDAKKKIPSKAPSGPRYHGCSDYEE